MTNKERSFQEKFEAYLRMQAAREKRSKERRADSKPTFYDLFNSTPPGVVDMQDRLREANMDIFDPFLCDEDGRTYWALIDRSVRPDYNNGQQMFKNDPLGSLLEQLRKDGKIPHVNPKVPLSSRFSVHWYIQDEYVFPALAKFLGVTDAVEKRRIEISRPTIKECVLSFGTTRPHLGLATWEWTNDWHFELLGGFLPVSLPLVYGNRERAGLTTQPYDSTIPFNAIAFRPVIKFPPQG